LFIHRAVSMHGPIRASVSRCHVFLRINFTTFEHNNVDRWGGENFYNTILKILPCP